MKQCPACSRTYDDSLSFCLSDGTPLVIETEEEKTVVIQRLPEGKAAKKSRLLLWLGLVGLIILGGISLVAGLLFYNYGRPNVGVQAKRQSPVNSSSSPTLPAVSKTVPTTPSAKSSQVEEPSPKVEESKPIRDNEDTEDITPIDWSTTADGFQGESGKTYTFRCPEEGTEHQIFGSDVYVDYSSICTAAVHTGLITLAKGGVVTIEFRPSRSIYGTTVRNGIKSRTSGAANRSFVVR